MATYNWGLRPSGAQSRKDGYTLPYVLTGVATLLEAEAIAALSSPAMYGGYYRQDIRVTGQGGGIWHCDAEYTASESRRQPQQGGVKWTFDTTGGTKHVTRSLETVQSKKGPGVAELIDHHGLIGVSQDSVEGVDVVDRAFEWTETWQLPVGGYGFIFSTVLGALTGTVNNGTFRGFPAGSVLFKGASGGKSENDPNLAEITFRFACSPNETNLTADEITGLNKKGWEYLWCRFAPFDDTTAHVTRQRVEQANVERVYTSADFSLLGIGTGVIS